MTTTGISTSRLCSFLCGFLLFSALFTSLFGQTLFWTENFNNGCATGCVVNTYSGPNGAWTLTNTGANDAFANQWYISCEETGFPAGTCGSGCGGNPCGSGCGNNPTLHVGSVPGSPAGLCPRVECGAAYDASNTVTTNRRAESPLINCSAFQNISVSFNFIGDGQPGVDECQFQYSSDGGSSWTTLQAGFQSGCCCLLPGFCGGPDPVLCSNILAGQGYWAAATINLPASADFNGNVKIGFNWTNNSDNVGSDPSFAVDAVELRGFSILSRNLVSFSGRPGALGNHLEWEFPAENVPATQFLERSENGTDFLSVFAQSPESKQLKNDWIDQKIPRPACWYRLRTISANGQEIVSAPILVENRLFFAGGFEIYPNPGISGEQLFIRAEFPEEAVEVRIYGLDGKMLQEKVLQPEEGQKMVVLDTSPLQAGLYILRLNSGGKLVHKKLILK